MFQPKDLLAQPRRPRADGPRRSPAGAFHKAWPWSACLALIVAASAAAHVFDRDSAQPVSVRPFGSEPVRMPGHSAVDSAWSHLAGEFALHLAPDHSPGPAASATEEGSSDARLPRGVTMRTARSALRTAVSSASPPPVLRFQGVTARRLGIAAQSSVLPRRVAAGAMGIRAPPGEGCRA